VARSLRYLAGFSGIVGLPTVSPDGGKLAFLHGDVVALFDPASIGYNSQTGLGDVVRSYGKPDYALFTTSPIPGVIRKEGKTGALGSSSFRAYGIQEKD